MFKSSRSKSILWGCGSLLAVCLLLIWIWAEDAPDKKEEITVILYEAGSGGWDSLQEGIRQASNDFSVNTNFITIRDDADSVELTEIIKQEAVAGVKGILLAAGDSKGAEIALQENHGKIPVVLVENGTDAEEFPCIAADDYEMGKRLAEEILADHPDTGKEKLQLVLNHDETNKSGVAQRERGFMDLMQDHAQIVFYEQWDGKNADVIAVLHKTSLLHMIENAEQFPKNARIYGIGGTAPIVAALDQGKIEKIVFPNEFNIGYLGTDVLIGQIRNKELKEIPQIDYYCVNREELYGTQYEQLLFTIIE